VKCSKVKDFESDCVTPRSLSPQQA